MEKMKDRVDSWYAKGTCSEDESEKCCGKCRFARIAQDTGMKCIRHKIRTDYICRCGDWRRKEPA